MHSHANIQEHKNAHQRLILDISFIQPCADSYVNAAVRANSAAASLRDSQKYTHYRNGLSPTETSRVNIAPLSHKVFGHLGEPAIQHLNSLTELAASTGAVDKRTFVDQALRELAAAACRSNHGIVYMYATGVHAQVAGKALLLGLPVPTADTAANTPPPSPAPHMPLATACCGSLPTAPLPAPAGPSFLRRLALPRPLSPHRHPLLPGPPPPAPSTPAPCPFPLPPPVAAPRPLGYPAVVCPGDTWRAPPLAPHRLRCPGALGRSCFAVLFPPMLLTCGVFE